MNAAPPTTGLNTYVSFADANALAADRLNAVEWRAAVSEHAAQWDEETPADGSIPTLCRQALVTATATLERLPWSKAWKGLPASPGTVPIALAIACAELAFYLLSTEGRHRRPGVQMAMIGQAMETYYSEVTDELPKHIRRLIEPFLRVRSSHSAELIP